MTRSTGQHDAGALSARELARILRAGVRPIPDWPGYYATAAGDVLSVRRGVRAVILRTTAHPTRGHLKVKLYRAHLPRGADHYVHRLVCLAWHGPPPVVPAGGLDGELVRLDRVLHDNDDETDNRPENLRWGDQVANNGDRRWNAEADGGGGGEGDYYARHVRAQALAGALGIYLADPRWGF